MTGGKVLPLRRVAGVSAEMSDEALVAACAQGDSAALGALFDRFHASVYRFLSRYVGQGADVDDLVQATFLEVQRSAPRFGGRSSVQTWIFGVAANLARHHVRSEVRRGAMLVGVAREAAPLSGAAARPDERTERRQQLEQLAQAVAELSPDHRAAFLLCDVEEVPGVEVARALGVREGTLWRRLHEARKALRAALERGQ